MVRGCHGNQAASAAAAGCGTSITFHVWCASPAAFARLQGLSCLSGNLCGTHVGWQALERGLVISIHVDANKPRLRGVCKQRYWLNLQAAHRQPVGEAQVSKVQQSVIIPMVLRSTMVGCCHTHMY